jgi:predicted PurR-regulated permease PerM
VDFISDRKLIFSKKCVPRGLAIAILLTMVFLIAGGLLTYTVPKTVNGIQRVGTMLKSQYPKYQEQVLGVVDKFKGTELGAFLKSQLENKADRKGIQTICNWKTKKEKPLLPGVQQMKDSRFRNLYVTCGNMYHR